MSNYTKATNFASKDSLASGNPLKIVKGTEIDTEFNSISTAIATKTDNSSAAITGGTITGITDLAVADGGTGASTAANARTNLSAAQSGANSDITSLSGLTTALSVAQGGTGSTTLTSNNVLLGNGTSALQAVAPGTSGNVLLSNGTTWTSSAYTGGVTSLNGQTGAIVTTTDGNIGAVGLFLYAGTTDVAYGATVAGSDLRYNFNFSASGLSGAVYTVPFAGLYQTQNNPTFGAGGTALSGTWRKLSSGQIYNSSTSCGITYRNWGFGLFVRVS